MSVLYKRERALAVLLIVLLMLVSCAKQPNNVGTEAPQPGQGQQADGDRQSHDPVVDPIRIRVNEMTIEAKIGQMVMAGVNGTAVNDMMRELIRTHDIGGFIFFKRNMDDAEQTWQLINDLKQMNTGKIPLLLSVDQEGGRVTRLPGLRSLPSSQTIGAVNEESISHTFGRLLGEQVGSFGLNMNIAPVLDIHSNPANQVIGDRAFGHDAETVQTHGLQVMAGMQAERVIPVVKHFPGHGDTATDSHIEMPVVHKSLAELMRLELQPFATAIEHGADVVMSSHILLPDIDPHYPATLSTALIGDVLRDELQFDGVVITDDLTMSAITKNYLIGEAAVMAINAGHDMVMVAHELNHVLAVLSSIKLAVESGAIDERTIDDSVYRILRLKEEYGLTNEPMAPLNIDRLNANMNDMMKAIGHK